MIATAAHFLIFIDRGAADFVADDQERPAIRTILAVNEEQAFRAEVAGCAVPGVAAKSRLFTY